MPDIVTIDGPAASGKSTIAKRLAAVLGFRYINSGNYYRAITQAIIRDGVDIDDADRLKELLTHIAIEQNDDQLLLDGEDVSEAIRSPEATSLVSAVAKVAFVRDCVNNELRRVASRYDSIVEGRDIGTVVFPDASLKVFLKASIEERARRRQRDFAEQGIRTEFRTLVEDLRRRDGIDSTRETAPLKCADDALVIDSTGMTVDDIVDSIGAAWRRMHSA